MSLFSQYSKFCRRSLLYTYRNKLNIKYSYNEITSVRRLATGTRSNFKGVFKLGLTGVTVGAVVGTGYTIHKYNQPRQHIINKETTIPTIDQLPQIPPSRKIRFDNANNQGVKLTLFQYQTCPFCCKVRAFLDFYGISYDIVEVDPVLRQSIKWSSYKKVPILVASAGGLHQPMNDSSMIISALATFFKDQKELRDIVKCYPHISFVDEDGTKKSDIMNKYFLVLGQTTNEEKISEERKWRQWADNVLVHMLSPNVYRTRAEAFQAFNWFSEVGEWEKHFPSWERQLIIYVGASAMYFVGKRLRKKYNLKNDVRESLYDECNYWARAVKAKKTKFMGGEIPNLADLAVYGVLCSIEGCDAFKDVLNNSKIKDWYYSMKDAVENHKGAGIL